MHTVEVLVWADCAQGRTEQPGLPPCFSSFLESNPSSQMPEKHAEGHWDVTQEHIAWTTIWVPDDWEVNRDREKDRHIVMLREFSMCSVRFDRPKKQPELDEQFPLLVCPQSSTRP